MVERAGEADLDGVHERAPEMRGAQKESEKEEELCVCAK